MQDVMRPQATSIAELHEIQGPAGRIWRFVTSSEGVADHAWQQRDKLLQLSNGAAAIEIYWLPTDGSGEPVEMRFSPPLPVVLEPLEPVVAA